MSANRSTPSTAPYSRSHSSYAGFSAEFINSVRQRDNAIRRRHQESLRVHPTAPHENDIDDYNIDLTRYNSPYAHRGQSTAVSSRHQIRQHVTSFPSGNASGRSETTRSSVSTSKPTAPPFALQQTRPVNPFAGFSHSLSQPAQHNGPTSENEAPLRTHSIDSSRTDHSRNERNPPSAFEAWHENDLRADFQPNNLGNESRRSDTRNVQGPTAPPFVSRSIRQVNPYAGFNMTLLPSNQRHPELRSGTGMASSAPNNHTQMASMAPSNGTRMTFTASNNTTRVASTVPNNTTRMASTVPNDNRRTASTVPNNDTRMASTVLNNDTRMASPTHNNGIQSSLRIRRQDPHIDLQPSNSGAGREPSAPPYSPQQTRRVDPFAGFASTLNEREPLVREQSEEFTSSNDSLDQYGVTERPTHSVTSRRTQGVTERPTHSVTNRRTQGVTETHTSSPIRENTGRRQTQNRAAVLDSTNREPIPDLVPVRVENPYAGFRNTTLEERPRAENINNPYRRSNQERQGTRRLHGQSTTHDTRTGYQEETHHPPSYDALDLPPSYDEAITMRDVVSSAVETLTSSTVSPSRVRIENRDASNSAARRGSETLESTTDTALATGTGVRNLTVAMSSVSVTANNTNFINTTIASPSITIAPTTTSLTNNATSPSQVNITNSRGDNIADAMDTTQLLVTDAMLPTPPSSPLPSPPSYDVVFPSSQRRVQYTTIF